MTGNIVLSEDFKISEFPLQKLASLHVADQLLDGVDNLYSGKMTKTASNGSSVVDLFMQMLNHLNLTASGNSIQDFVSGLSKHEDTLNKSATMKKTQEKHDELKIVSKALKDSHYKIDVSKDIVEKKGHSLIMISCFAKDDYLGRYIIKRNFFFNSTREASADQAYNEIMVKMGALKDRYYNDITDVAAISTQMKKILDGVISEVQFEGS